LKVLYFSSGLTGSGRIVRGISIGNAFKRKNEKIDYLLLNSSDFSFLTEKLELKNNKIPSESETGLSRINYKNSILYNSICNINPDILIIDLTWHPLFYFLKDLKCKKIFLCRQVHKNFFSIHLKNETLVFDPKDYDHIYSIEPFKTPFEMKSINPILLRNKDEILSKPDACHKLNINKNGRTCFLYYNGEPNDFENVKKMYSYIENEGYQMIYSTNYDKGLFPIMDYFNAADLLVCGGGYNSFWEAIYFNKETIFVPTPKKFESQEQRIAECQEYYFEENGADQLVDIIMNL
jgi:hypothetical protein